MDYAYISYILSYFPDIIRSKLIHIEVNTLNCLNRLKPCFVNMA